MHEMAMEGPVLACAMARGGLDALACEVYSS